jgi:DEAD/DEAH box helicase domain-containing protein
MLAASARDPNANALLAKYQADSILPARVHVFHRTLTGLWTCIDPECPDRPEAVARDWPFGAIYFEAREHCASCHSIVLEWAFCARCGEGALKAETKDDGRCIAPWDDPDRDDCF